MPPSTRREVPKSPRASPAAIRKKAAVRANAENQPRVISPGSLAAYEKLARPRVAPAAWDYIQAGSADEVTLRANRTALDRLRLKPRVLVDVSQIDTRVNLFGGALPHPILLAPAARHMFAHPEGEVATARGAAAAGATLVLSLNSNCSVEEVTRATSRPVWFQLYVDNDRDVTKALIQRAEAAGCQALCIAVDLPVPYARRPLAGEQDRFPLPHLGLAGGSGGRKKVGGSSKFTWKDLEWVRSLSKMPVVLKGILNPDDAEQAVKCGVAGMIVSNHGGRGLDSTPATIEALPAVADRVAGKIPVLMDGGIRRGTDVLKALAHGATAVLVGRPYLHGLAVNGADGVRDVIEILRTEFEAAMALTGRTSIAALDRTVFWLG